MMNLEVRLVTVEEKDIFPAELPSATIKRRIFSASAGAHSYSDLYYDFIGWDIDGDKQVRLQQKGGQETVRQQPYLTEAAAALSCLSMPFHSGLEYKQTFILQMQAIFDLLSRDACVIGRLRYPK
jgi:hypothetical protein